MKPRFSLFFLIVSIFPALAQADFQSRPVESNALKDYEQGMAFYARYDYVKALEYFRFAADEDMEFWQAYQMAGYCHYYLREMDETLDAFEESLRLNPDNPRLVKIYNELKSGSLSFPLQPVAENKAY